MPPRAGTFVTESRIHRKDRQFCRQVQRTLELVLLELEDPALAGLVLIDVSPAPDATRLRVVLAAPSLDEATRAAVVRVQPRLRAAVACHASRKRVPELALVLVPETSGAGGGA